MTPADAATFAGAAVRLSGAAGVAFGWTPGVFWTATPAELAAWARACVPDTPEPADGAALRRMMEAFPDG